jgi:hypothetical protein
MDNFVWVYNDYTVISDSEAWRKPYISRYQSSDPGLVKEVRYLSLLLL